MQINRSIRRRSYANIGDYVALTKPRVMSLVVFTALVGLMVAPGGIDPFIGFAALVCIAAGAGAAGALNMWYDADIDAMMARTAIRPIPSGRVSRPEALVFGLMLGTCAVLALGTLLNMAAAALLAFTIFFYVVVYTMWLKRRTPQNIVIGGAAGALPPVIGWVAVTGHIGLEPLILFLIIFLWTPPHFWALSLNLAGEYARAGVPMLPVVAGKAETKRQILLYSALLVSTSLLPCALGFAGAVYGAAAVTLGAIMIFLAWQVRRSHDKERRPARRLFVFSMLYLVLLFGGAADECCALRSVPLTGRIRIDSRLAPSDSSVIEFRGAPAGDGPSARLAYMDFAGRRVSGLGRLDRQTSSGARAYVARSPGYRTRSRR
ncbi:protoheme IX farnesyltransferase [Bradyrhizobium elkanii]